MRKPIIAANWKMYKNIPETVEFINTLRDKVSDVQEREIIIAPSFIALDKATDASNGSNIQISAQDIYFEEKGAYTSQISAHMLDGICSHVIIGHSERREFFGDSNEDVNKKMKCALASGFIPIMCIGELREERDSGKTFEVLAEQLSVGLQDISAEDYSKIIIAYEPVWAISRGDASVKPATPDDAQAAHKFIRDFLKEKLNYNADETRLLYGGSVKPANVKELMAKEDIDGGLVGGASLDVESFEELIRF